MVPSTVSALNLSGYSVDITLQNVTAQRENIHANSSALHTPSTSPSILFAVLSKGSLRMGFNTFDRSAHAIDVNMKIMRIAITQDTKYARDDPILRDDTSAYS